MLESSPPLWPLSPAVSFCVSVFVSHEGQRGCFWHPVCPLWTGHLLVSVCEFPFFDIFFPASSCRVTPLSCLSATTCPLTVSLFSTATRCGHHGVLRSGSGAGGVRRHVLQQLLPLPALQPGPGSEQRRQPVGAQRAPGGGEVSGDTSPLNWQTRKRKERRTGAGQNRNQRGSS